MVANIGEAWLAGVVVAAGVAWVAWVAGVAGEITAAGVSGRERGASICLATLEGGDEA